jgi:hypothetical protein
MTSKYDISRRKELKTRQKKENRKGNKKFRDKNVLSEMLLKLIFSPQLLSQQLIGPTNELLSSILRKKKMDNVLSGLVKPNPSPAQV